MSNAEHFLWEQKYRPETIDDCILPDRLKTVFKSYVEEGQIPQLLLAGPPGLGKTTVAKALCADMGIEALVINASLNGNIDTLRTTIHRFASTKSLRGKGTSKTKVVILDEADYLNANSTQPALRGFMDEFAKTCRFILTCNYPNKIIEPLRDSRCTKIDFTYSKEEKKVLAGGYMKRICSILDTEGVQYEKPVLAQVILKAFPDFRQILTVLQRAAVGGKIEADVVQTLGGDSVSAVVGFIKNKEFNSMRKWVAQHAELEWNHILGEVKTPIESVLVDASIPEMILILARYDREIGFSTDRELQVVSCFTELMMECEFK